MTAGVERPQTRRWQVLAVLLTGVTLTLFVSIPILAPPDPAGNVDGDGPLAILWLLGWLGFPLVGGFLAVRRPEHPIGWILIGLTLGISTAVGAENLAIRHAERGPVPFGAVATWLTFLSATPAFLLVPFLVLLFPSGRVESILLRRLAKAAVVVGLCEVVVQGIRPFASPQGVTLVNPLGVPSLAGPLDLLAQVLALAYGAFGVVAFADAVRRSRRSTGVERLQFRWFTRAATVFPIGMGLAIPASSTLPLAVVDTLVSVTFFVSFNGMALAIGIAVLRYRLYEIDRIVSRTVAYTVLTGLLVAIYAMGVLGIGVVLPGERNDLAVAVSTLAVAALFRPLRSRIQAWVDRRFNRSRYDAAVTVERFGFRLRDQLDVGSLERELVATSTASLSPSKVALWRPAP